MFKNVLLAAAFIIVSQASYADFESDYQTALNKYINRDTVDQNETLQVVDQLKETATGKDLYKVLILGSKASWWKGSHENNLSLKKNFFYSGMMYAIDARSEQKYFSESYLWQAYNLAELSLIDGTSMKSLIKFRVPILERNFAQANQLKTSNHTSGAQDDGFGAIRNLGQMNVKLFAIPGRLDLGLSQVQFAYDHDKTHPRNFLTYAKVLIADYQIRQNAASLIKAKQILNAFIVMPVQSFSIVTRGQVVEDQNVANILLASLP